jgi:biotin-(acetyl-CoA carboxylase) ligase
MVKNMQVFRKKELFTSSMDWARSELKSCSDGTIFLADKYHVARGQNGREWKLYGGQAIVTIALKPDLSACNNVQGALNNLNMAIAVAIAENLRPHGVFIKKPNDFMIKSIAFGAIKKIGGMLIDVVWEGGVAQGVVVGLCINCNNSFDKNDKLYPVATSLIDEFGERIDVDLFLNEIVSSINKWYSTWKTLRF